MNKFLKYIGLCCTALYLASCTEENSSAAEQRADAQLTKTQSKETSTEDKRYNWPPVTTDLDAEPLKENYLVILDDSGSMSGERIKQAKDALRQLAKTLPEEHNLGLICLNNTGVVNLDVGNRQEFLRLVNQSEAHGGTPLAEATAIGYELITKQASRQKGYGTYHIIIVTDGASSDGSPIKLVRTIVGRTPVQIHVVGFHLSEHEMNRPRLVDYQTANNTEELIKAFAAVAAETNDYSDPQEFSQ